MQNSPQSRRLGFRVAAGVVAVAASSWLLGHIARPLAFAPPFLAACGLCVAGPTLLRRATAGYDLTRWQRTLLKGSEWFSAAAAVAFAALVADSGMLLILGHAAPAPDAAQLWVSRGNHRVYVTEEQVAVFRLLEGLLVTSFVGTVASVGGLAFALRRSGVPAKQARAVPVAPPRPRQVIPPVPVAVAVPVPPR